MVDQAATREFAATYPARTVAIADARRELSVWLRENGVPPDVHEELLVVLSELLANAVAASVDEHQQAAVAAHMDADCVVLEVTNPPASEFSLVDRYDYDDPLRPGGRGLVIVESLVDDLAIVPPDQDRSLSVRCRRQLRPLG